MAFDGKIITMSAFEDFRGYLSLVYDHTLPFSFSVRQINQGYSKKAYTLRGLHFQEKPYDQAKLITCLHGAIFSVAVDIRTESLEFGHAYGDVLSFENRKMMYIPKGYAHGYLTLEDNTLMQWCVDNDFCKDAAKSVKYDDPGIVWEQTCGWPGEKEKYIASDKDKNAMSLMDLKP